jgi:hypothetical protein
VTHDECHFYANNGWWKVWIGEEESILRPKHLGHSIMVSDFLCLYYELLQLPYKKIRYVFDKVCIRFFSL